MELQALWRYVSRAQGLRLLTCWASLTLSGLSPCSPISLWWLEIGVTNTKEPCEVAASALEVTQSLGKRKPAIEYMIEAQKKYIELGQISWELKSKTGSNQVWAEAQGSISKDQSTHHPPCKWEWNEKTLFQNRALGSRKRMGLGVRVNYLWGYKSINLSWT